MSPELLVATMQIQRGVIDDLSNQRVAVVVHTTAGQSDEHIIRLDPQWINGTIQFNDADHETGYVEVPLRIDVRHFRTRRRSEHSLRSNLWRRPRRFSR